MSFLPAGVKGNSVRRVRRSPRLDRLAGVLHRSLSPFHGPGCLIRLALGGIARFAHGERRKRGRTGLLHDVHQFVRQQFAASGTAGPVFAVAEENRLSAARGAVNSPLHLGRYLAPFLLLAEEGHNPADAAKRLPNRNKSPIFPRRAER